jgi:hypothetical protein
VFVHDKQLPKIHKQLQMSVNPTQCCVFVLQSRHHWLLTVAAESVVRLLYPLKYQHVYIPVMPSSLADYLEVHTRQN